MNHRKQKKQIEKLWEDGLRQFLGLGPKAKLPKIKLHVPSAEELLRRYDKEDGFFANYMFLPGGGRDHFEFPTADEVEALARRAIESPGFKVPRLQGGKIDAGILRPFRSGRLFLVPRTLNFKAPVAPTKKTSTDREAGYAWAVAMDEDQWAQPIWQLFEQDHRTLTLDKGRLPEEYHEMADSLEHELSSAEAFVVENLPKIAQMIVAKYPDASAPRVYQAALRILGQIDDLRKAFVTIQLWTTGFRQYTDPKLHDRMELFRSMLEAYFLLAAGGDLRLDKVKDKAELLKRSVKMANLKVGHAILPVLVGPYDSGPAVIPIVDGMLGPKGGHLAFIPWNIFNQLLAFVDAIYKHEGGHLLQADIVDYIEQALGIIQPAFKSDEAKNLGLKDVALGSQKIPGTAFWRSVFLGQFLELDADSWMIRTSGPQAARLCFSDFLGGMHGQQIRDLDKVAKVLRNYSTCKLVKTKEGWLLKFDEPHPQDNVRIGKWMAAIALLMLYLEVAKDMASYADTESGGDTTVTWEVEIVDETQPDAGEDGNPDGEDNGSQGFMASARTTRTKKSLSKGRCTCGKKGSKTSARGRRTEASTRKPAKPKLKIEVSVEDFGKAVAFLADKLHNTPMPSLGGLTMLQHINLTPQMHKEQVDPLVDRLMQEKDNGVLPDTGHHIYFHFVGAAAEIALHRLIEEKKWEPVKARKHVEAGAEAMLFALYTPWVKEMRRLGLRGPACKDQSCN